MLTLGELLHVIAVSFAAGAGTTLILMFWG
jgi:hypothetical protein